MGDRSKRPVPIGASDGNAEAPRVNRRAALGANDDIQFCLVDRAIAERRNVAGERHLHLAGWLIAEQRNGNIADLKPPIIRTSVPTPDELLFFLYRFLQGPSGWCDLKGRRLLERHRLRGICCWGCLRTDWQHNEN